MTGTDRFGRKLTQGASHALLSSEACCTSRLLVAVCPGWRVLCSGPVFRRAGFPGHCVPKLSGQTVVGIDPLSANCLPKDTSQASPRDCLLAQRMPNQALVPTSCTSPWWLRGHHQGSQPQTELRRVTMPVTSSNPLTLANGLGKWLHGQGG